MKYHTAIAITLVAVCAVSARAEAENVYRCGSSYSQSPCPEGQRVDVQDARTPEQKAQADAMTRRDADAANTLEKARLAEEARQQAAQAQAAAAAAKAQKQAAKSVKTAARGVHTSRKRPRAPARQRP